RNTLPSANPREAVVAMPQPPAIAKPAQQRSLAELQSGLRSRWAEVFPDPRQEPEIGMEVLLASQLAARFAGLYSMRKAGYVLRSAAVLGALGSSVVSADLLQY
ncbi:MAG: hypothetical protein ACHQX3_02570, partial [Nitrospirales bacterium]